MTIIHTDTDDIEIAGIDMLDAVELAEICDYVADWIRGAPSVVGESLARFGASGDARTILLEALDRFGALLVPLVPPVNPAKVGVTAPLGPGEALGLAELPITLAIDGWPTDPDHSEALEHDRRWWALRVTHIPGVIR